MQEDAILLAQNLSSSVNLPTNIQLSFEVAKISDLPIEACSFDAITLVNGLHFIETDESVKSLQNLSRGLKPGGLMYGSVCSIFNASCIGQGDIERFQRVLIETSNGEIDLPYKSFHRRYGDMFFYTEATVKKMLELGGFKLIMQKSVENTGYPNGFGEKYKENIDFIAEKI
jgi:ubiquinone/menaquinone biosynthesis C-methylase UbiE